MKLWLKFFEENNIVKKNPTELLSMLVNYVINLVQIEMKDKTINYLAIGCPPSFTQKQISELNTIGETTGISHFCLYSEPLVVCRYYSERMRPEETTLVIDCGAGSFDATILKVDEENSVIVIGHTCIDTIGGERYTQRLMDFLCERSKGTTVRELSLEEQFSLKCNAENTKRSLGTEDFPRISTGDSSEYISLDVEELWKDFNDEIVESVKSCLMITSIDQIMWLFLEKECFCIV